MRMRAPRAFRGLAPSRTPYKRRRHTVRGPSTTSALAGGWMHGLRDERWGQEEYLMATVTFEHVNNKH